MHVDNHRVGDIAQGRGVQLPVHGGEGVVHGVHMHPTQQVDHQHPMPALGLEQLGAATGGVGQDGIVGGADQARFSYYVGQGLALVPGVVAQGQAVGPGLEQLAGGVFGDAKAGGGVLGVDDDELQAQTAAKKAKRMIDQSSEASIYAFSVKIASRR